MKVLPSFLLNEIQRTAQSSWLHKLLSIIALPLFRRLLKKMKADQYNGASFDRIAGYCNKEPWEMPQPMQFFHAIEQAVHEVEQQVPTKNKNHNRRYSAGVINNHVFSIYWYGKLFSF